MMKVIEKNRRVIWITVLTVLLFLAASCSCSYLYTLYNSEFEPVNVEIEQKGKIVTLSAAPFYRIYYTTDGSIPTQQSKRYILPFSIKKINVLCQHSDEISIGNFQIHDADVPAANVVRAMAVAPDGTQGEVVTTTCFERTEDIAVVSIIVDYSDLLDYDAGILVKGRVYDEWIGSGDSSEIVENGEFWSYEGNYKQKGRSWERQALIEIYDNGDKMQIPAGIRVHGGMSRMFSQRGFNIYFREDYGAKYLDADIFGNGITRFESLTLRNGGNAADTVKYKDSWIQRRLEGMDFAVLSSRPALVYINGEYWGIYILQEKYSESYIEEHFGAENIVMIKENELEEGDSIALYEEFLGLRSKDLNDPDIWNSFKETVDIRSMADYFAAQIYIGNYDLRVDKNIAMWRSVEKSEGYSDGRWRFMIYDTEYSSSLYNEHTTSAEYDHFGRIKNEFPIFAKAMEVEEFRNLFDESMREVRLRFSPDEVEESLYETASEWEKYLSENCAKFGGDSDISQIEPVIEYFRDRYSAAG